MTSMVMANPIMTRGSGDSLRERRQLTQNKSGIGRTVTEGSSSD